LKLFLKFYIFFEMKINNLKLELLGKNEEHSFCKSMQLKKGELLTTEGNIDQNIYIVISGALKIFIDDENKTNESIIRFAYKDSIITAMDSFITGKATLFNICAIKKSNLLVISKKDFTTFINNSDYGSNVLIEIYEDLILQQINREIDLLTSSPLERYNRVRQRSPRLFQEIPLKYIASYLRMTPETFSRIQKS